MWSCDPDFDEDGEDDGDWGDLELNEDGQQLIPIQTTPQLTLATVLKSINLPPDTNLDNVPKDVLCKLVEKMPIDIFEQLEAKYGDKIQQENKENKKQQYRHKLSNIYNMKHIVNLIKQSSKILILTGASNIPDFRSKDGIKYAQQTNDSSDIFDLDFFLKKGPKLFYLHGTTNLFKFNAHQYNSSRTHYFVKTLQDKNKLLRMATQNIDGLGLKCGILSGKINQCHGTTSSFSCVNCNFTIKTASNFMQKHLKTKSIPYCIKCREGNTLNNEIMLTQTDIISNGFSIVKEEKDDFTNVIQIRIPSLLISELKRKTNILKSYPLSLKYSINEDIKHEMFDILELRHDDDYVLDQVKGQIIKWLKSFGSYGVFKPNMIFFNESLKKQSLNMMYSDVKHCDLVVVIGTSMLVDPFGSIPNLLDKNIPLILVNREIVGLSQYEFDVNVLGNCDDICEYLLYEMEWKYDVSHTIINNQHKFKFIPPNYCLFKDGKLPQNNMKLKSIKEEKDVNTNWNIGDKIQYKHKKYNNDSSNWYCGCGIILDVFISSNKLDMIKIKLGYGVVTIALNKIEINILKQ